jgi:hypothetical protein
MVGHDMAVNVHRALDARVPHHLLDCPRACSPLEEHYDGSEGVSKIEVAGPRLEPGTP